MVEGENIPLDLHLEHLNNFFLSFMIGLGPNLSAARISKSIGILKELMDKTDTELERTRPTGIHHVAREQEDILTLVNVFRETRFFKNPKFPEKRIGKAELPGIMTVDEV